MARPIVIFLHSSDWESRYQASTLAATSAALGDQVHLALFFGALQCWVEGRWDEGAPPLASGQMGSLRGSLEEVRQELGVRVVACETAVHLAGYQPAEVASVLDGIVSLPELWRLAQKGQALIS